MSEIIINESYVLYFDMFKYTIIPFIDKKNYNFMIGFLCSFINRENLGVSI